MSRASGLAGLPLEIGAGGGGGGVAAASHPRGHRRRADAHRRRAVHQRAEIREQAVSARRRAQQPGRRTGVAPAVEELHARGRGDGHGVARVVDVVDVALVVREGGEVGPVAAAGEADADRRAGAGAVAEQLHAGVARSRIGRTRIRAGRRGSHPGEPGCDRRGPDPCELAHNASQPSASTYPPRRHRGRTIPGGVLVVLRQVVGDLEPRCLRADEDVLGRADGGRVDERSHRDVHVLAVAHDREQQRAADRAARVVQVVLSVDQQARRLPGDLELLSLDTGERLERRAGRRPAARAMAVRRVPERVRDPVADRAALAPPVS